jgi:hypothetical protein
MEHPVSVLHVLLLEMEHVPAASVKSGPGVQVLRGYEQTVEPFLPLEFNFQGADDSGRNVLLRSEEAVQGEVVRFRP